MIHARAAAIAAVDTFLYDVDHSAGLKLLARPPLSSLTPKAQNAVFAGYVGHSDGSVLLDRVGEAAKVLPAD